jgi:hypothetical protein
MMPQAVTGYKDFYGAPAPEDAFVFLKKYPTDLIILELSKINALIFQERDDKLILLKKIIAASFSFLNENKKQLLGNTLTRRRDPEEMPVLFSSQSISKLISLSFDNYYYEDTDKQINTVEFQNDLWDNILVANEIYYAQLKDSDDVTTYKGLWKLGMMQQSYIRSFNELTLTGNIKVLLFYKFLKNKFESGNQLIDEFIKSMKLNGFFDYGLMTMEIVSKSLSSYDKDGQAKWVMNFTESQLRMTEYFSYRPTDFQNGKSINNVHRQIMTHPFYFLLNKHPIVIDFNFLSFMAEISLTFNFYSFTSLNGSGKYPKFKDFKGMLGKFYYEEFIMDQLIRSIFCGRSYKVFDDKTKKSADFTVVHEKDIYFFEIKSADLSLDTLENNNAEQFEKFIIEQYATNSNQHGRRKGIYQLLKHIKDFATTDKLDGLLNGSSKNNYNIYSIVVYTENALDIPGVNGYLNDIFQKEAKIYKSHFKKVYPVTAINLTTFIEKYSLLKESPLLLKKWIKGYWNRCNSNRQSFEKSRHPYQFLKAGNPFKYYLNETLEQQDPMINFRTIVESLGLNQN